MSDSTSHSVNWHDMLIHTLSNLRNAWPKDWPGLPVVLTSCMTQLWPSSLPREHDTAALLNAALDMAKRIESIAGTAAYEPQYHNRLHTADALVSVCCMLQALRHTGHHVPNEWAACLLLAVTSHDVLHPGGANSYLQEFEQQSVQLLTQMTQDSGVSARWVNIAAHLILHTDPTLVVANHDKVSQKPFVMDLDWAVVLMNEADILASATEEFGTLLGKALANEWQAREHPLHHVVGSDAGRLHFLSSLRFSTPVSDTFRLPQSVSEQINRLRFRLGQ